MRDLIPVSPAGQDFQTVIVDMYGGSSGLLLESTIIELENIKKNCVNSRHISLKFLDSRQEVITDVQEKVSNLLADKSFLHSIESINASIAP